jgi:hypothetical protein
VRRLTGRWQGRRKKTCSALHRIGQHLARSALATRSRGVDDGHAVQRSSFCVGRLREKVESHHIIRKQGHTNSKKAKRERSSMKEEKEWWTRRANLSPLASKPPGELEVLGLDRDSLGVDGTQVGVLEEGDEVGFRGFLKGHDGARRGKDKSVRSASG